MAVVAMTIVMVMVMAVIVRVAPGVPYHQDFSKVPVGAIPGGWVNCGGKFVVVELNKQKVLKKTNTNPNPLLARANTYIGMPTLKNYTIRAEVLGMVKNNELPDMGVVANRYTLVLDGNKQQLRLLSWDALPRVDESIQFAWNGKTSSLVPTRTGVPPATGTSQMCR